MIEEKGPLISCQQYRARVPSEYVCTGRARLANATNGRGDDVGGNNALGR